MGTTTRPGSPRAGRPRPPSHEEGEGVARLEQLALAETGLRALLEAVDLPAVIAREDGQVVYASRTAEASLIPALQALAAERDHALEVIAERVPGAQVRWLATNSIGRHALVFVDDPPADTTTPLDRARSVWGLTRRQSEVMCLLAEGKSNREIAKMLACSERTVELHVASLFRKAGCESRTALVAKFWRSLG